MRAAEVERVPQRVRGEEGSRAAPWRAAPLALGSQEQAPSAALLDRLPDPVFVLDAEGRFTVLSRAWEALTGTAVAGSLGRSLAAMAHPDDAPEVCRRLHGLGCGLVAAWRGTFRLATPRRGEVWVEVHAALQAARAGCPVARIVGTLRDVTFAREREADLRHLGLHDALLGIPNRTLLLDRLERRQARALRDTGPLFALAFVDLNGFKTINDTHGHLVGDDALRAAAGRLTGAVRASDTVARFGGDEFAVLLDETRGPRDAVRSALRMCRAVGRPLTLAGRPVALACSVGVVTSDVGFEDLDQLLGYADAAMYHAKQQGSGVALFGASGRGPRRTVKRSWRDDPRLDRMGLERGRRRFP